MRAGKTRLLEFENGSISSICESWVIFCEFFLFKLKLTIKLKLDLAVIVFWCVVSRFIITNCVVWSDTDVVHIFFNLLYFKKWFLVNVSTGVHVGCWKYWHSSRAAVMDAELRVALVNNDIETATKLLETHPIQNTARSATYLPTPLCYTSHPFWDLLMW